MIRQRLASDLKEAVEAGDHRRSGTLRLILAAIKDRDIAARTVDAGDGLDDAAIHAILARMVGQREESARLYEEGGRLELAAQERDEIAVIRRYLPRQMSEAEVAQAVQCAIRDCCAKSIRDMGRIMAHLRARHPGRMDFAKAGAAVKDALR